MANIYDQHAAAFSRVSAYAVMRDGERVATIAFKFPQDGAGRLYAYVHWIGAEMVRGHANGYGYDKRTAACASARAAFAKWYRALRPDDGTVLHGRLATEACAAFWTALERDTGPSWSDQLHKAGFTVYQAV